MFAKFIWGNGYIHTKIYQIYLFCSVNCIIIATIFVQFHFRILLSSIYYRLAVKFLLVPCHDFTNPIGLTYTINIAMSNQIQITQFC